jgi:hypothetical protein
MQTFLPYPDFTQTARCLDRQRLGKQRVETLQILNALTNPQKGWQNHPATNMWRNHEHTLVAYGLTICEEWIRRGYKDTCLQKILNIQELHHENWNTHQPAWLGNPALHLSHQSNLLRKNPDHYNTYFQNVPPDLPYIWPTIK